MSNKIGEIINKSITEMEGKFHPYYIDGYGDGFDAAMELQLPVLFARWIIDYNSYKSSNDCPAWVELYDYWITNVYPNKQP